MPASSEHLEKLIEAGRIGGTDGLTLLKNTLERIAACPDDNLRPLGQPLLDLVNRNSIPLGKVRPHVGAAAGDEEGRIVGYCLTLMQRRDGTREVRLIEDEAWVILVRGPGGVSVTIKRLQDGRVLTEQRQAASEDELRQRHPDAWQVYDRWIGPASEPESWPIRRREGLSIGVAGLRWLAGANEPAIWVRKLEAQLASAGFDEAQQWPLIDYLNAIDFFAPPPTAEELAERARIQAEHDRAMSEHRAHKAQVQAVRDGLAAIGIDPEAQAELNAMTKAYEAVQTLVLHGTETS